MKNIVSLLLTLLFFNETFAQKLSDEQIQKYLDGLQKEQIITEFGKDAFLKTINNQNNAFTQRMANSPFASAIGKIPDSLSKSKTAILGFIGIYELLRNVGSAADEMIQFREMAEKMLGDEMLYKPEIEGNIQINNPITFLGLEQNLRPTKERYISIANRLKAIQLIDEKVYADLLIWLKKDQIKLIKDFGFFIYAAKQSYFYDNYGYLKSNQIKFIDSLQTHQFLSKIDAQHLKDSYKDFELKSKIDILTFCKDVIILPADQKKLTREEIYQNQFKKVNEKFLPTFQINQFKLEELKNDTSSDLGVGLPFNNPFSKNKKSYKLSYTVNGKLYSQKADTDFSFIKTLQKSIPSDVDIDSSIIQTYANVFSFLTGITNKDFQSINDYLIDQHSTKRVIIVSNDYNPFVSINETRKALILVDSTQNKVFEDKSKNNLLFGKSLGGKIDFSFKTSRDSIYALVKLFQNNKILPIVDQEIIENAIQSLRFEPNKKDNLKRNLVVSFPKICAKINVSPKNEEDKIAMFKNFISELSLISNGKFNPEKISDNFASEMPKGSKKDRELIVSFKLNSNKYENKFTIPKLVENEELRNVSGININPNQVNFNLNEWLEMVNQSLNENEIDGQFYKITTGNRFSFAKTIDNFLFLDKNQYNYLEKNHPEVLRDPAVENIYGNYQEQIAAFKPENFAQALKREKMITEDDLKEIKNAKEPSEILQKSTQVVVIDMNELAEKSDTEIYNYILNEVKKKLLPKTKFSEIKYLSENLGDSTNDYSLQNISAIIDDKPYAQTLNVSLRQIIKSNLDSLKKPNSAYFPAIGENQFKIINDYLTDISSPKRLVIVCDYRSPKLSFVFFDSTQATIVSETLPNNYVDFSMYGSQFSRDSLNILLDNFNEIGLIKKFGNAEKESFIVELRKFPNNNLSLLENLPNVVAQTNIWDVESYENVFKACIDTLKKVSRNKFNPKNVVDNFSKTLKKSNYINRVFEYSFEMENGKKYTEKQFVKALEKPKSNAEKIDYEVFDFDTTKFIELINKALNESNSDSMFYQVFDEEADEDEVGPKFLFLSSKQYRWLKAKYPEIFESYSEDSTIDIDEIKEEK